MLKMEVPGWRKRGKPQRRFLDAVKEAFQRAGVGVEDARPWQPPKGQGTANVKIWC